MFDINKPSDLPQPEINSMQNGERRNAAQEHAWKEAYKNVISAQDRLPVQRRITDDAVNVANHAIDNRGALRQEHQFDVFFGHIRLAVRELRNLRGCHHEVTVAWGHLHAVETAQPWPNPQSLAYALNARGGSQQSEHNVEQLMAALQHFRDVPAVPPNAAGQRKVPARWIDETRERSILNERRFAEEIHAGRVGLPGSDEETWVAQREFSGGMSKGWLWLRLDQYHTIVERVFRKDCFLSDSDWSDPRYWDGDVKDPTSRTPLEVSCNDDLMGVNNFHYVVRLRHLPDHVIVDDDNMTYRFYLAFEAHRDLCSLIHNHRQRNVHIPESMIWYIAEALAECGLAMQRGSLDGVAAGGEQIVHRDLKPLNVFLGDFSADRYPDYPKPVLGDFGLAFKTQFNDPNNPRWYNTGCGTDGFRSPEHYRWYDANTKRLMNEWKMLDKTNVYGVGLILWALVNLRQDPPEPFWLHPGQNDTTLRPLPHMGFWPVSWYSWPLKDLIGRCLRFDPANRPSFREILDYIRDRIASHPAVPDEVEEMRDGTASLAVLGAQQIEHTPDAYQIGMSHANI